MPLGCFSLFYWYADSKHITPHHNCKIITAVVFDCVRYGGDEEDRTLDLTDANRTLSQLSYAPICHRDSSGK